MSLTALPPVQVDMDTELLVVPETESQVSIVLASMDSYSVYADPLAKLVCEDTGAVCNLVTCLHISLFPETTVVSEINAKPVLVFEALPKACTRFSLIEPDREGYIPFVQRGIKRNDTDVYRIAV